MELVAEGERGGERGVVEVPHEGRGVEEADGGDAQAGWGGVGQEISLCAASMISSFRRTQGFVIVSCGCGICLRLRDGER